jgi:adenosylcobalamin-dependent ribonucleoside-triphosphate reductase
MVSTRALVTTRRTYNRPTDTTGKTFETWEQTIDRVISHQKWLWQRAKPTGLTFADYEELEELRGLMLRREALPSGRTLWLGGTGVAKRREASMFNCSFERIETVHDVVDAFWLLLQGCGVGFEPVVGTLSGFSKAAEIVVYRSTRTDRGYENNLTNYEYDIRERKFTFHLVIGDSAEAWAKSVGKLLAEKRPFDKLVLDFSQVRPAGERLKGYGWISSGDTTISKAFVKIAEILSKKAGKLLNRIDILDILNHLGTTLSSRRSAEIAVVPFGDPETDDFILAKKDFWLHDNDHRQQSNNSLLFYSKPTRGQLWDIFLKMEEAGGSEPGFINAQAALKRAPWFKGVNPCAEILLGNKSFCNLVEVDLGKFNGRFEDLERAVYLIARANYRQTCVNLDDGILQRSWHELNEFLRLCGVGLTGIVKWEFVYDPWSYQVLRTTATEGAHSMADELGLPRAKAVTTVKPSGTLSKIMDTTEGVHRPLGKFIFNNMNYSKHDPIVPIMREAGYKVTAHPNDETSVLITFPVRYDDVEFDVVDGAEVNLEPAIDQLERYKLLMENYVDHNCSITIYYDLEEVPAIIDWIEENWDTYVGVSFIYRTDPTKTAKDLGYAYLPQEVVTEETYNAYVSTLKPFDLDASNSLEELTDDGCATGACPIR